MKTFHKLSGVLFLTAMCLGVGCSAAMNKAVVSTLIESSLAECIAMNPDTEDKAELQKLCHFADGLWPLVKQLILARKQGEAKLEAKKAAKPMLDAGSPSEAGLDAGK